MRQSGARAILTKPFELKQLRAAIFTTLNYLNPGSLALEKNDFDIENLHVLIVDDRSFGLAITDYNMPEMDGRELVKFIHNKSRQNTLPIIMITSEQDEKWLAVVKQAGVSAICDNPFDPKNLIEQIDTPAH